MAKVDKKHSHLSVVRQCKILGLNRSSYYYRPKPIGPEDVTVMNEIRELWLTYPFYGYRRIHWVLKRNGHAINRKRVLRLMRVMGIQALYPKRNLSWRNPAHSVYPYLLKDVKIKQVNHAWATDLTYIRIRGGFVYLVALIDIYSRYIVGWALSPFMDASLVLEALHAAEPHGWPEILNSDQGSQFTGSEWVQALESHHIHISMDGKGRWADNIYIERFWRTVKYEQVYLHSYDTVAAARQSIGDFIYFYNNERPHQALNYQIPGEVYYQDRINFKQIYSLIKAA